MNRSCTCERNMDVKGPLLVNRSGTCEQDLQMTSATPRVNGTIAHGSALKHAILCISTYHDILRLAIPYEPQHDKTNKVACALSEDSDQPGHPLYAQLVAKDPRFLHVDIRLAGCPGWSGRTCDFVCFVLLQLIYHAMSASTLWCLPGHSIYLAMDTRPYQISYRAHQAIQYTIPCPPGHTIQ